MDMKRPAEVGVLSGGKRTDLTATIAEQARRRQGAWTLA